MKRNSKARRERKRAFLVSDLKGRSDELRRATGVEVHLASITEALIFLLEGK